MTDATKNRWTDATPAERGELGEQQRTVIREARPWEKSPRTKPRSRTLVGALAAALNGIVTGKAKA